MATYKQVINRTVKQYAMKVSGIKWKSMSGSDINADTVNTALTAFTDSTPVLTDKVTIVGKKKSLLSAVLSLFQTSLEAVFQPKKASTELYVSSEEKSTWSGKQDAGSYASSTHNHNLNDLSEKSYNSLTNRPTIPDVSGKADKISQADDATAPNNATFTIAPNTIKIITTELNGTSVPALGTVTITPAIPTDLTRQNEATVVFKVGTSKPTNLAFTPSGASTFVWMDKAALSTTTLQVSKTYTMVFFWERATVCQVYYAIKA